MSPTLRSGFGLRIQAEQASEANGPDSFVPEVSDAAEPTMTQAGRATSRSLRHYKDVDFCTGTQKSTP